MRIQNQRSVGPSPVATMIWLLVLAAVLFLTIPLVGRAFGFALDFWRSIL